MVKKIPVTIITGFLGAGKTTLINRALFEEHQKEIAVIVNEFGEIGVDHQLLLDVEEEIYQLNNGCICCALRSDIANVLHAILNVTDEQGKHVDNVLIETTGIADPSPIAQTFSRVEFLEENFQIDAVITLVDALHIRKQLENTEEAPKQIAFADKIFLTKSDKVTPEELVAIHEEVKKINPFAEIAVLNLDALALKDILDLKLYNRQADTLEIVKELHAAEEAECHDPNCSCHHHHHDHDHHDHHHHQPAEKTAHHHQHHQHSDISSFVFTEKTPLRMEYVQRWLNELVYVFGEELYRYKGLLNIGGEPAQIIFQGVNMSLDFSLGRKWPADTPKESVLVFIGKDLPERTFEKSFQDMVAASEKWFKNKPL